MKSRISNNMTCKEIYEEIDARQIYSLMFHDEMANYYDFLGLMGFKRVHEYHYLKENVEHRRLNRYYINHHNEIFESGDVDTPRVIPSDWYKYDRFDVTSNIKQKAIKDGFAEYRDLVREEKEVYSQYAQMLFDMNMVADADLISKLVDDKDQELKLVDRMIVKMYGMDYNMPYITVIQDDLHSKYQEKTKEIGVDIC